MTIEGVRQSPSQQVQQNQKSPEPIKLKAPEEAKKAESEPQELSEIKRDGDERPAEKRVRVEA